MLARAVDAAVFSSAWLAAAAAGLVAASAAVWKAVPPPDADVGATFLREWCGALWASGRTVVYDPSIVAVRVDRSSDTDPATTEPSSWQRVLALRPDRPRELTDGVWRYLLAHDDVMRCRP